MYDLHPAGLSPDAAHPARHSSFVKAHALPLFPGHLTQQPTSCVMKATAVTASVWPRQKDWMWGAPSMTPAPAGSLLTRTFWSRSALAMSAPSWGTEMEVRMELQCPSRTSGTRSG